MPNHLCDYGCGKEGKFKFKNGKWCCSKHSSKCSTIRNNKRNNEKFKKAIKNRKIKIVFIEKSNIKCSYGCGKTAKYYFKNVKKWCCSKHYLSCSHVHQTTIKKQKLEFFHNKNKILCSYGCKQFATYRSHNNIKFCCSENWAQCPEVKKKNSKNNRKKQSGEKNARYGITLDDKTIRKIRLGNIRDMENKHGQIFPNYNKKACELIDDYGQKHGYTFQHAENGGEYHIKELGYWVDGYDENKNVVIEVDESAHFDFNGNLKEKDVLRQKEIKQFLKCEFIRIKNL